MDSAASLNSLKITSCWTPNLVSSALGGVSPFSLCDTASAQEASCFLVETAMVLVLAPHDSNYWFQDVHTQGRVCPKVPYTSFAGQMLKQDSTHMCPNCFLEARIPMAVVRMRTCQARSSSACSSFANRRSQWGTKLGQYQPQRQLWRSWSMSCWSGCRHWCSCLPWVMKLQIPLADCSGVRARRERTTVKC